MAYTKTTWVDRVLDGSGNPTTAGTALSATNLNKLETGVDDAHNGNIVFPNGSASAPSITFSTMTTTGFYRKGTNTISLATAGTEKINFAAGGSIQMIGGGGLLIADGTLTSPSVRFLNDTNTGIYQPEADAIGFVTNGSEKSRINLSGHHFINTTAQLGGGTITSFLNVASTSATTTNPAITTYRSPTTNTAQINFTNGTAPGTVCGTIATSGGSVSYGTNSDYRLKENVKPMANAVEKIKKVNPVTYTWKRDGSQGQGFIAHELQAVFPEAVNGEKDAVDDEGNAVHQSVDASFLIATLVKAVQELSDKVSILEARK
jgi:hypothetical protein